MKMFSEEQILDIKFRKKVIDDINSDQNKRRKKEAFKRHEIFRDKTVKWVIAKLKREGLMPDTIALMENRAANISIARKVVEKLARCYSGGVMRETGNPIGDTQVTELAKMLDFDTKQKKVDKYVELFKNCHTQIVPEVVFTNGENKIFRLKKKVLAPWQYDVIEDARDPESAACLILSDYVETTGLGLGLGGGPSVTELEINTVPARGQSQIASSVSNVATNDKSETYIWWTPQFHFTTDSKGQILKDASPEDLKNPVGMIPGASYSDDQDGNYWATGGQDLTDGAILVNTLITDMLAIAYIQGWGQLVITGKHVSEQMRVGPHVALVLTYDPGKDEPEPKVQVVNANPPLADWMAAIEQYVALLLSTNNLSPSNISTKLDVANFPSGIAMLIEKSEATGSIEDKQKTMAKGERQEWELIKRWQNVLMDSNSLTEEFKEVGKLPDDLTISTRFNDTKEVVTEAEKLDNLKKRKDLGLNTEIELILMDNPDMTHEQAEEKLLKLKADRLERNHNQAVQVIENKPIDESDEEDEEIFE